jgi:hypothetical protein
VRPLTIVVLLVGFVAEARAQDEPSSTITEVPSTPAAAPPSAAVPPSLTVPPPPTNPPPQPNKPTMAVRASPSPDQVTRWRDSRVLSVTGSVLNVVGTGLSLTSAIYIAATDYPPSATSLLAPAKPTDTGPALAYAGASVSLAGFVMSAAGLGWEHRILDELGADPGLGRFGVGTTFGVFGFLSIGTSYFFGLTHYLDPHDRSVTILATSITGTALCAIGGILYLTDSSKVKKAWEQLTTF